jgi:hypothetical protein
VPFGVVSLTLLANMVLHDQLVLEGLGRSLDDPLVEQLRLINAALNVTCFVGWSIWAVARRPSPAIASARAEGVAWATVHNL